MGREAKITNNLTRKQFAFVRHILSGESATEAAFAVYSTSSRQVASSIAYENLNKPLIKEAINESLNLHGLSLSSLVSELAKLARGESNRVSADVQLRSIIEVLKLLGVYKDMKRDSNLSFWSQII